MINAVGTLDGRGAVGGKSTPIGTDVDHLLMRNIRANVDAVLVGAGTLRSENLTLAVDETLTKRRTQRGLEAQPLSIILTQSGGVPSAGRVFREKRNDEVVIFAGPGADRGDLAKLSGLATVREAPEGATLGPEEILDALSDEFGVRRLLVEGGPSVNRTFLEAGLVDELYFTLAPKVVGGNPRSLVEGDPLPRGSGPLSLASVYLCDSELYLRYLLSRQ